MPLPRPVERQHEVVCLPALGHQVVLGTAGSGKTTMAILRAAFLADPDLPNSGPTLLLTFNKSLGAYIRSLAGDVLHGVHVEHYHRFARGYLSSRGVLGWNQIAEGSPKDQLIAAAVANVRTRYAPHSFFDRPIGFFSAEVAWLGRHGILSSDEYVDARRTGRADARLEGTLRPVMWAILEEYRNLRAAAGKLYDWDDLASSVAEQLNNDENPRRYKHIVIDEGQDLSPEMLKALSRAIPPDGSLTFFGDVAQQIYGHRMSWRSAGLNPLKIWEFKENYRNTSEIAKLGLAIAGMPYYAGLTDMVAPNTPRAEGPKPTLVRLTDLRSELTFIANQASRLSQTQSVGILTKTVRQYDRLKDLLPKGSHNLREDTFQWAEGPGVFYGTYHSAKGLEFDAVILPFLSEAEFPDPQTVTDFGMEEAAANDGRLLYVGVTRARRALILSYNQAPTALLPPDRALYTEVTV